MSAAPGDEQRTLLAAERIAELLRRGGVARRLERDRGAASTNAGERASFLP